MDQNPQPFEDFVLGAAVLAEFVVHQDFVIPLPVYLSWDWPIYKLLPSIISNFRLIANFKFSISAEREDNNFQIWIKTAVNKIN